MFIDAEDVTDTKKAKRLSKEYIKKKLLDSMDIDKIVEIDDLNKEAEEVQDPQKASIIIKRYEDIIKTKRKGIINVAYHQEQVFNKTAIICKINVFKLCKKYPKLLMSSVSLGFLKDHHKDIKAILEENEKDFQGWAFLSFKSKSVTQ